jgi:hypothetical protein
MNSLLALNPGGTIVLHDLNPHLESEQVPPPYPGGIWTGDCWKAAVALRLVNQVEFVVVDIDYGVGVLRVVPNRHPLPQPWYTRLLKAGGFHDDTYSFLRQIPFEEFDKHREELYRMVTLLEMRQWLETTLEPAT